MKKIFIATAAIIAFTAPSFAQDKTTGQAPPSGASSFYVAQDTATMKCEVVNAQPSTGSKMKVIGAAHPTQASAQTALAADKTCMK
jgi:type 1 fimbria pilin